MDVLRIHAKVSDRRAAAGTRHTNTSIASTPQRMKTETANVYRAEPGVPRRFRVKSFAERKKAFERVTNVLARKVQQSVNKCAQSFNIPPVYSWPGWAPRARPTSNAGDTVETLYETSNSCRPSVSALDATPLAEEPDKSLAADLPANNEEIVPSTPRRFPDVMLPRAIGSERAELRTAETIASMNASRPLLSGDDSVVPAAMLNLPALTMPRLDFFLASGWVEVQADRSLVHTAVPDREDDPTMFSRKRVINEPWNYATDSGLSEPDLTLSATRNDGPLMDIIFWDADDQGYPGTTESQESSPSEVHLRDGVQTYQPIVQLLPDIPPPSPLQISFDIPSEVDADNRVPSNITESVKKIFTDAGFLTVPNVPRTRRWSHISRASDVSSEVSTYANSPCTFSDALSSSDCGDSSSDDTCSEGGFFSDGTSDMGSPKDMHKLLPVDKRPAKWSGDVKVMDEEERGRDAHVKTWLGERYWGFDGDVSNVDCT
ncbi:hypothetical protein EIP91_001063 [Steccherinum ochraceum]|uniref:Uncharacterized protein n=1 Tax=Steccherinum ochraceum TaxID=92696 RepID=A0A4R0RH15_9APHY|nr:hypothetical protein EIP91_001063 [Steccherinum ochraceum]